MSDYTPDTAQVRADFATRMAPAHDYTRRAGFDRWLEHVRAEAKAEALAEAADGLMALDPCGDTTYWDGTYYQNVTDWLRARAVQIRKNS